MRPAEIRRSDRGWYLRAIGLDQIHGWTVTGLMRHAYAHGHRGGFLIYMGRP